eukprot:COSAG03_NODE_42_length_17101_cov_8.739031_5_plen_499_part_00
MGKNRAGKGITSRQQAIKAAQPVAARPTRKGAPGKLVGKAEADALSGGKRKNRNSGGASGGNGYVPNARKQRRRDERMERKRAKLEKDSAQQPSSRRRTFTQAQLSAAEAGGSHMQRDGEWRKDVRRQRLQMQRAVSVAKQERERLEFYIPPHVEDEIAAREKQEHKRLQSLHPVARKLEIEGNPALGYVDPGSGSCIVRLARPAAENLFETTPPGSFASREETRPFLEMLRDASDACRAAGKADDAVDCLRELERLDSADTMDVRPALVLALLDADADEDGAAQARGILERHPQDQRTVLQYSRALIEYIGWRLLEEDGCTEETASAALSTAIECNPFAAIFIAHNDAFVKFVDPVEVDSKIGTGKRSVNQGTVEEAFRYGVDGLSCWRDADGSSEWVLNHLPAPLPAPVGSELWTGIYNEALEHAMESMMVQSFAAADDADHMAGEAHAAEQDDEHVPVFASDGSLLGFQQVAEDRNDESGDLSSEDGSGSTDNEV